MNAAVSLWIYILLLVVGGLFGYFKRKSQVSLYTSLGFGAALSLCAARVLPPITASWLLGALLLVFAVRLARTRKFMPAGFLLVLTMLTMALIHLLPWG